MKPFCSTFTERPGKTNVLMHVVDTLDARAKHINPRPLSVHEEALAFQEMIDTGAAHKSRSPWPFSIVLVPKKDARARLCANVRELITITVRVSYPFPSVDSTMYDFGSACLSQPLIVARGFFKYRFVKNTSLKQHLCAIGGLTNL